MSKLTWFKVQNNVIFLLSWFSAMNLSNALAPASSLSSSASSPLKSDSINPMNSTVVWEGSCVVACDSGSITPNQAYFHKADTTQNSRIAFSAIRNEDNLYEISQADRRVVVFDYVAVNRGNAYDKERSAFTASVNGVFKFDFNVVKHFNRESLTVALTVNGEPLFVGFADGNTANHEVAQNGGLVFLKAGDVVRIEIQEGRLDTNWEKSTFSGFLVYESEF